MLATVDAVPSVAVAVVPDVLPVPPVDAPDELKPAFAAALFPVVVAVADGVPVLPVLSPVV